MDSQKIQAVNMVIVEKANLLKKRIHTFKYNYAGIKEAESLFGDKFAEYNPKGAVLDKCLDNGFIETETVHVSLKY